MALGLLQEIISQAALLSTWGRNTWLGRSAEMDAGVKQVSKIVNRSDWLKSVCIGMCEQEWGLWQAGQQMLALLRP